MLITKTDLFCFFNLLPFYYKLLIMYIPIKSQKIVQHILPNNGRCDRTYSKSSLNNYLYSHFISCGYNIETVSIL